MPYTPPATVDFDYSGGVAYTPPATVDFDFAASILEGTVSLATETDTAFDVTPALSATVELATETDTAFDITPEQYTPRLFAFPVVEGFNATAILQPGYQVFFYELGFTTEKPVWGDNGKDEQHANPVVLDRIGNMPDIYLLDGENYRVVVKSERGVYRYELSDFVWPDTVNKAIGVEVAEDADEALEVSPVLV